MIHCVIVFNTNQLNHFGYKNKSQQHSTNFNSHFSEKVKHLNNVNKHSSEKTDSQKAVNQMSALIIEKEYQQTGSNYFKQKLSSLAAFAINQYETFANIETQQKNASILGLSEYA